MLDKPLKLGEKVWTEEINEYYLRRIRLNELPGWPPKLASTAHANQMPSLLECKLLRVSYLTPGAHDQGGILYSLEYERRKYQAWHVDCPYPLLMSVEATLKQEGLAGRRFCDLQELRLIGESEPEEGGDL